jgi:hypothetical protein
MMHSEKEHEGDVKTVFLYNKGKVSIDYRN